MSDSSKALWISFNRRSLQAALIVAACGLFWVDGLRTSLSAQAIQGRVLAADTDAPISGAFVTLVDSVGERVGASLSRSDGNFLIRAPRPGRYDLRAEMIGYAGVSQVVELAEGETTRRVLRVPLAAIQLAPLVVSAGRERQCHGVADEAAALSRLWEKARQGLQLAEWSEAEGRIRATGYTYDRLLDLVRNEVLTESVQRHPSLEPAAFVAPEPEEMMEHGFVRAPADGGAVYNGADAALLLSDAFLETHCFRIAAQADDGQIGLAFEPVPSRRVAEIRGVLWIDAETAELRSLEYDYTRYHVDAPVPASRFGGTAEFRRLPDGTMAVESWRIRMPQLLDWADLPRMHDVPRCGRHACEDGTSLRRLDAAGLRVREVGGRVLSFRLADGSVLPAADDALIAGTVVDSTTAGSPTGLAGAEVLITGTMRRAVTDATGRFRIDNLAGGHYRLEFRHPRLSELGLESAASVTVTASPGAISEARLGLPSPETLARLHCQSAPPGDMTALGGDRIIYGAVSDATTGAGIPEASVRVRRSSGQEVGDDAVVEQTTDPSGRFVFCAVPDGAVEVSAEFLGRGHQSMVIRTSADRPARADIQLVLSSAASVMGRVTDAGSGAPVAGSVVRITGTGLERVTDERGRFRFDSVSPGVAVLRAEHIAYVPAEGAVAIHGGETVQVELRVADQVHQLIPLVVTARARPLLQKERMGGFYIRQARGLGTFFDRADFEQRPAARVSDFLGDGTGLRVNRTATGTVIRSRRRPASLSVMSSDNPLCSPMIYLDGVIISSHTATAAAPGGSAAAQAVDDLAAIGSVVDAIPTSELAGIEVYAGPSSVPGEYSGLRTDCGVVLIWTNVSDHSSPQ